MYRLICVRFHWLQLAMLTVCLFTYLFTYLYPIYKWKTGCLWAEFVPYKHKRLALQNVTFKSPSKMLYNRILLFHSYYSEWEWCVVQWILNNAQITGTNFKYVFPVQKPLKLKKCVDSHLWAKRKLNDRWKISGPNTL